MPCCLPFTIAYSYAQAPKCFQCLIGHTPIYGSPFKSIAFDLWTFPIDSYVQIVSKYGLSSCSFSDILTLVDFMQMNVHPRSF